MWHIVAIGYLFVAVMYSAAQPSIRGRWFI